MANEISLLRKQNERMRTALENIKSMEYGSIYAQEVAERALEELLGNHAVDAKQTKSEQDHIVEFNEKVQSLEKEK